MNIFACIIKKRSNFERIKLQGKILTVLVRLISRYSPRPNSISNKTIFNIFKSRRDYFWLGLIYCILFRRYYYYQSIPFHNFCMRQKWIATDNLMWQHLANVYSVYTTHACKGSRYRLISISKIKYFSLDWIHCNLFQLLKTFNIVIFPSIIFILVTSHQILFFIEA